jgi:pyruvate kinase
MFFLETKMFIDSFTVRMNFSHGSYEYHQSVIDNTRAAVKGTSLSYMI